ncbi:hypothetical protein GCM10010512_37280 [Streptomyces thermoviolaceus subsp. thermoviolaceus]|nr:hypothetical protein GCM10010512_37280 [Streptomyces thermoviolaceus subsp. thermoviolaceus]
MRTPLSGGRGGGNRPGRRTLEAAAGHLGRRGLSVPALTAAFAARDPGLRNGRREVLRRVGPEPFDPGATRGRSARLV